MPGRPKAHEILQGVLEDAEAEVRRNSGGLALSGFAAGMIMGFTPLGVAILGHELGSGGWQNVVAYAAYPLGFIAVIIGRAQLFTENTLYPVVLVLDRRSHVRDTARLWTVVFCANVLGALVFAVLMAKLHTIHRPVEEKLVELGHTAVTNTFGHVFWTAVIGGWLIALVAWLVEGTDRTIGQIVLVWLITYLVGIGGFAHCIASSGDILTSVLDGAASGGNYVRWLVAATLGNAVGGVVIVALLNYGQVMASGESDPASG